LAEPRVRLHIAGKILHIAKKKNDTEKRIRSSYEMRWATPEDFLEIKVMPRMMLDHFPPSVGKPITKVLKENSKSKGEEEEV
jgi:sn1-specific diacylglycerol lipase